MDLYIGKEVYGILLETGVDNIYVTDKISIKKTFTDRLLKKPTVFNNIPRLDRREKFIFDACILKGTVLYFVVYSDSEYAVIQSVKGQHKIDIKLTFDNTLDAREKAKEIMNKEIYNGIKIYKK